MANLRLCFMIFLVVSAQCNEEIDVQCPKLCQCSNSDETGLTVKCESVKDIKEIVFTSNSTEIVHL